MTGPRVHRRHLLVGAAASVAATVLPVDGRAAAPAHRLRQRPLAPAPADPADRDATHATDADYTADASAEPATRRPASGLIRPGLHATRRCPGCDPW